MLNSSAISGVPFSQPQSLTLKSGGSPVENLKSPIKSRILTGSPLIYPIIPSQTFVVHFVVHFVGNCVAALLLCLGLLSTINSRHILQVFAAICSYFHLQFFCDHRASAPQSPNP